MRYRVRKKIRRFKNWLFKKLYSEEERRILFIARMGFHEEGGAEWEWE